MTAAPIETAAADNRLRNLLDAAWVAARTDRHVARRTLHEARSLAADEGSRLPEPEELALEAILALRESDLHRAGTLGKQAVAALTGEATDFERARSLFAHGSTRASLGDYAEAIDSLEDALTLARRIDDGELEVDALTHLASVSHLRGEFLHAIDLLEEALPRCKALHYLWGEAGILLHLGNALDRLGDYAAALDAHQNSRRLHAQLNDLRGEVSCLNNLGNLHIQLGEPAAALEYYRSALGLCRKESFTKLEGVVLGNEGLAHQLSGETQAAIVCHRESLAIKEAIGDIQGAANTYGNLGAALVEIGDYPDAAASLDRALALHRQLGDRHGEAHSLIVLGRLRTRWTPPGGTGGPQTFVPILEHALELADNAASPELAHLSHEVLAEGYKAHRNFEKALEHFELFHKGKEKLINETVAQRTRALQVRHEVELHRLRTIELAEALAEAERQRLLAEQLAQQDSLTGLLSRRRGDALFAEAFAHARRYHRPLTVVLADIDHFKRINDSCSHQTGDAVLREVGRIFQETCRTVDVIVRFGGEEFLLVLPETTADDARSLCDRIRAEVAAFDWKRLHPELAVTISMGICDDMSHVTRERLLSEADANLYRAKRAGRNQIRS